MNRTLSLLCCLAAIAFASPRTVLSADYALRDAVESTPRTGLPNVFAKLASAQSEIKIAYLGGSITAQPGWRVKSLAWFREQFPSAKISDINAAIGGTGSDLGVFRVQQDVLRHQPDLLFIEFAVNDSGAEPAQIHRCMEGIVRQTLRSNSHTDICFVYTLSEPHLKDLQAGKFPRAASAMEELADYYGIPSIHLGLKVARMEKDGSVTFKGELPKSGDRLATPIVFSPDGVHPFPETGHELYLQALTRSMPAIRNSGKPGAHPIPKPLRDDNWEQAKLVPLTDKLLQGKWTTLDAKHTLANRFRKEMPVMRMAEEGGSAIQFKFKGSVAGIYDLLGPDCGQISIKVDDRPERLSPRFDGYCTYHRLGMNFFVRDSTNSIHTLRLVLQPNPPDKAKLLFERNRPDLEKNPSKYEGARWYAGPLMIIGELVE